MFKIIIACGLLFAATSSTAFAGCLGDKVWVTKKWSASAIDVPDKRSKSTENEIKVAAPDNALEDCISTAKYDWSKFKSPLEGIDANAILKELMQNIRNQACNAVEGITAMPAEIEGTVVNQFNGATQNAIDAAKQGTVGTVNNSVSEITGRLTGAAAGAGNQVTGTTGAAAGAANNATNGAANGANNQGGQIVNGILP